MRLRRTTARYGYLGRDAVLLYLNRGERFCGGASLDSLCRNSHRRSPKRVSMA
jgi:hypothetical protein